APSVVSGLPRRTCCASTRYPPTGGTTASWARPPCSNTCRARRRGRTARPSRALWGWGAIRVVLHPPEPVASGAHRPLVAIPPIHRVRVEAGIRGGGVFARELPRLSLCRPLPLRVGARR